jgi:ribose-phosphate pyrophosphokinase
MARGFANRLHASLAIIDKRRPEPNMAEVANVVGEVDGRNCLLIDDMVDTGGTLANAVVALKERGATKVFAGATHALLSGPAVERLAAAPLEEFVVTNTIHLPEGKRFDGLKILSVASLFATAIECVHENRSVSQLFEMAAES